MIVVLLGPPGSGKGTQAKILFQDKSWPHLSTGDMLRGAIDNETAFGVEAKKFITKGQLVPDSIVVGLVGERILKNDCKSGFILDGFPRNIEQADILLEILKKQGREVQRVIFFEMPEQELIRRLSGRRICQGCRALFHINHSPSKKGEVCDQCGGLLIRRSDDALEVIHKRISVYWQQTAPLIEYYRSRNLLHSLDASQTPMKVAESLKLGLLF